MFGIGTIGSGIGRLGATANRGKGGGWQSRFDDWYDFEAGRSKFADYNGLTDTWSGGLVQTPTGYTSVAANVLARSALGLQTVPTRVNKCTNRNANPVDLTNVSKAGDAAAVLSVVDDVAALAAAGLSGICTSGKVYKFDNSAGTGDAFLIVSGQVGNTNTHIVSAFVRGSEARIYATTGADGAYDFPASDSYRRVSAVINPTATTRQLSFYVRAGRTVYVILNQLEEGSFATPPIVTSGSAVTRTGNRQVIDLTGKLQYGVAGFVKVDLRGIDAAAFPRAFNFSSGTGAQSFRISSSAGAWVLSTSTGAFLSLGPSVVDEVTLAFACGPGFQMGRRVGGAAPAPGSSTMPSLSQLAIGGNSYDGIANSYQFTKKLGLIFGTPDRPINQALFDQVYAQAEALA
ncbi:MAG TPA: hypothetical protein VGN79_12365 [Devosia sp.]|jgi:hypothetical protein|nr:hypothetical protein [Devosia sp.]